jgi:hypothetical protein
MEINLGNERIALLRKTYSEEEIREKALGKRVEAFGQVARFFQRPKPEEIEISAISLRLEPYWYSAATARYSYDRRCTYRVPVSPEVKSVSVFDNEIAVGGGAREEFALEAVDHCVEESHSEIAIDAVHGNIVDFRKYVDRPSDAVENIAALETDGVDVETPAVRSSFLVRKLAQDMMKTFQADKVHEERIDVREITLFFLPIYLIEYWWQAKDKRQVLGFDAVTGEPKTGLSEIKQRVNRVLENDALFDIGADTVGMVIPGANIAIKLGRLAMRKATE